jgi:glycosyltransferase involved in cell wall biosynthesis
VGFIRKRIAIRAQESQRRIGKSSTIQMKILHAILSRGFYGSERYCVELAVAQARAGHDVVVLIRDTKSDCAREFRRELSALNPLHRSKIYLSVMPVWLPRWLHRGCARFTLARLKPDVVHSHLNPAARRVGAIAQRMGIPHVTTLHIKYDGREHEACDGLIAISSWQLKSMPQHVRDKATVIHPWLPRAVQKALTNTTPEDRAKLRSDWKVDDRTCVFGTVGRLEREKGIDVLLDAFSAAFPNQSPPVALVVVGDGPERRKLEELRVNNSRIMFAGALSDVARVYRAIDVFVSAARFEPFGIAIMEAMAAGLPLVLTSADGPLEFVPQSCALWSEPGDKMSLAQQLKNAAACQARRREYDLGPLSEERATLLIENFYRRILRAVSS